MSRYSYYNVQPMLSNTSVHWALSGKHPSRDLDYAKGVLRSYIDVKRQRGRMGTEISYKLEVLEEELPQWAEAFRAVRQQYGLPPSRVLRTPQSTAARRPTSTSALPNISRISSQPSTRPSGSRVTSTSDSTRLGVPAAGGVIHRVSTVSGSTHTSTQRPTQTEDEEGAPPPPYTPRDPEPEQTMMLEQRLAAEAEAAGRVQPDPMPNPVPVAAERRASLMDRPDTPPREPELAQAWEESQFEEAKRASLAAARERADMEEAMRLSLAEAECAGVTLPVLDEDSAGPSSRRTISYDPPPGPPPQRRLVSEATSSLTNDLAGLTIPGGWEQGLIGDHQGQTHDESSLDRNGSQLQSNNPFLSSSEREEIQEDQGYPGELLQPSPPRQSERRRVTSSSSSRDRPGSQYTSHNFSPPAQSSRSLPLQQETPRYTPPEGPPPAHLRIVTPPATVWPDTMPMPESVLSPQSPMSPPRLPARPPSSRPVSSGFIWDQEPPTDLQLPMTAPAQLISPTPPPGQQTSALTAPAAISSSSRKLSMTTRVDGEDPLETLREFDTIFLVDDSTSMCGQRWEEAKKALMEVAEIAAGYDENGVDIYFVNSKRVGKELRTAADVEDLFAGLEPKGPTPTGLRLEAILRDYMARLERYSVSTDAQAGHVKPMNLIVVTDGAPTDDPESVLISIAKRLDRGEYPLSQVGVQFLQIGDDAEAREALQELDDGLSSAHGIRDMVDTVPYDGREMTAGLIIKTLLGGINRRLDRRG
ncbi:hypothetical protein M231_07285 [Tremella mesenterica]|uniref:VWFA domain-containing protein n=1 Tax=Tremella mesenterica TaxID=5217 RepID=A0A4V1M329_TREME|nr:hypothetical protein M231_07285 [Tremella mesenterica]